MEKITFDCEVITPMFLAGADGKTPEIRPPSIKGALRFWWRAMNGHLDLKELKRRETEIFGGAGENEGTRSKVIIRVENKEINTSNNNLPNQGATSQHKGKTININILNYLGYGPCVYDRATRGIKVSQDYISPGSKFKIIFFIDRKYIEEIKQSFTIFTKYGNLGAKARNGFGSFYSPDITNFDIHDIQLRNDVPFYSAISKNAKLFKTRQQFSSWDKALGEIGKIYKSARESLEKPHSYNKRQYIGAPIIIKGEGKVSFLDRRAKPYFFHINKVKENFEGQILFLPSKYAKGKAPTKERVWDKQFLSVCEEFNLKLKNSLREVSL